MSNIIYNTNQIKSKYFYIYKITNLINNKIYIGQRTSKVEPTLDTNYMGSGTILRKAFNKYGKENFSKEIIEICKIREELNQREVYWIEKLNSTNKKIGYNLAKGGNGYGLNKNNPNYYKICKDISIRLQGHKVSEETKKKISLAKKGKVAWNKGKHPSEETKLKMSIAAKNRTPEQIRKINNNPEKIRKTAEKHRGMKRSLETRKKQSIAKQKYIKKYGTTCFGKDWIYIYNQNTNIIKRWNPNIEIPIGWIKGNGKKQKIHQRGIYKYIYNFDLDKEKRILKNDTIPISWVLGRKKYAVLN